MRGTASRRQKGEKRAGPPAPPCGHDTSARARRTVTTATAQRAAAQHHGSCSCSPPAASRLLGRWRPCRNLRSHEAPREVKESERAERGRRPRPRLTEGDAPPPSHTPGARVEVFPASLSGLQCRWPVSPRCHHAAPRAGQAAGVGCCVRRREGLLPPSVCRGATVRVAASGGALSARSCLRGRVSERFGLAGWYYEAVDCPHEGRPRPAANGNASLLKGEREGSETACSWGTSLQKTTVNK